MKLSGVGYPMKQIEVLHEEALQPAPFGVRAGYAGHPPYRRG